VNPARPAPGLRLCRLEEIAEPGAKGFRFREGAAMFAGFVARKDGQVRGNVDTCPHNGWPLSMLDDRYFTREKDLILCAGHGALFRPDDGVCVAGPCLGEALESWPVTVADGEVLTA
jgi:nitrite reductase/ring-hydroxylating ferredoxin subunit